MTWIVEGIREKSSNEGEYEVLIEWLDNERGDDSWEPFETIAEDIAEITEDYLYNAGERNLKRKILDLYFQNEYLLDTIFMGDCNKLVNE